MIVKNRRVGRWGGGGGGNWGRGEKRGRWKEKKVIRAHTHGKDDNTVYRELLTWS